MKDDGLMEIFKFLCCSLAFLLGAFVASLLMGCASAPREYSEEHQGAACMVSIVGNPENVRVFYVKARVVGEKDGETWWVKLPDYEKPMPIPKDKIIFVGGFKMVRYNRTQVVCRCPEGL